MFACSVVFLFNFFNNVSLLNKKINNVFYYKTQYYTFDNYETKLGEDLLPSIY